jgi:hypothetical protein
MILATYDGFYLHIWKYKLFNREESIFEHKTHTIRAILFPLIIWFLFINNDEISFWIGLVLVLLDLIVLGIDAYSEKDSRQFMGGLPKWEYIIHLFANGFHFASIMLIIGTKISINELNISLIQDLPNTLGSKLIEIISVNIIPGSILLALIHLIVLLPKGRMIWNRNRIKITCC